MLRIEIEFCPMYVGNRIKVATSSVASSGLSDHYPMTVVRKHNGFFAKTNVHKTIQYHDFKVSYVHVFRATIRYAMVSDRLDRQR